MSRPHEINVNASITVNVLGVIPFHVMVEYWKHVKDTLAFSLFLVCENRNRILLTSDLLPNMSQVVGRSLVNKSLPLRACDISTSRLTSNQSYIWQ